MISKTKISYKIKKKTNLDLIRIINYCKKNNHLELAKNLSKPRRIQTKINLDDLEKIKEDKIMVCGKILSNGEIKSKKTVVALAFSKPAIEKLKHAKCDIHTIKQFLEKGNKFNDYKII